MPARMPVRAVALVGGLALLLAGCGNSVRVNSPTADAATSAACQQFLAALPTSVADQSERTVSPADGLVRAYGDPDFTITCGAGAPSDFGPRSKCIRDGKISWYVPHADVADDDATVHLSLIGWTPQIEVDLPASYRPSGPPAVMSDLGPIVTAHLTRAGSACS